MSRLVSKALWIVFSSFGEPKGSDKPLGEHTSPILGEVILPGLFPLTFSSSLSAIPKSQHSHLSFTCHLFQHRELHIQLLALQDILSLIANIFQGRNSAFAAAVPTATTQTHSVVNSVHRLGDGQEEGAPYPLRSPCRGKSTCGKADLPKACSTAVRTFCRSFLLRKSTHMCTHSHSIAADPLLWPFTHWPGDFQRMFCGFFFFFFVQYPL